MRQPKINVQPPPPVEPPPEPTPDEIETQEIKKEEARRTSTENAEINAGVTSRQLRIRSGAVGRRSLLGTGYRRLA